MAFNSYNRATAKENRYLFNDGAERVSDLDLGVDLTKYRTYDPLLGRWWQIDPKSDGLAELTPYNYSFNNPIRYNDPNGDCPPGVDCDNPLPTMQVRRNRASNLGPGNVRTNGTQPHHGQDLYSPAGTQVSSSLAGKVVSSYSSTSYGNTVVVKSNIHPEAQPSFIGPARESITGPNGETNTPQENIFVQYSHLTQRDVAVGDVVTVGQQVGTVGTTGNASPGADGLDTHLHIQAGTELAAPNRSIRGSSTISPNIAYNGVSFGTADPATNQTNTSVVKTVTNGQGQQTRIHQQVGNTGSAGNSLLLDEVTINGN